jgi:hypothetical protein
MTTAATSPKPLRADALAKAAFVAQAGASKIARDVIAMLAALEAARAQNTKLAAQVRDGRGVTAAFNLHNDLIDFLRNDWGMREYPAWHYKYEKHFAPELFRLAEQAAEDFQQALAEMHSEMLAACAVQPLAPEPTMPDLESLLG